MDNSSNIDRGLLAQLWAELGGSATAAGGVEISGPLRGLPSVYEVSALASATIGLATLAVAELQAVRTGQPQRAVHVERRHADAAFQLERLLRAVDWALPAVWDPLAGDYRSDSGWVRLHTNYSYHRDAVLRVLGLAADATRDDVAARVARWDADALEDAVVAAEGCAAKLRSPEEWRAHPQGRSLREAPLFDVVRTPSARAELSASSAALSSSPLAGLRVLDLTRVIAGPVGTRLLAAYGADVLRVDPPGFEEVGVLLCEITAGKRRCALDLRSPSDRERFVALVSQADLIVHGYRSDALARLGFGNDALRRHNRDAVIVCHDAYGWSGPWAGRRGFDSLVQMSCGIAWRGAAVTGSERPLPLPAQALDHATGYLIAAASCQALTRRIQTGETSLVRLSLARTAQLLMDLGDLGAIVGERAEPAALEGWLQDADSQFGRVRRVRCPGQIEGVEARWQIRAGSLGLDAPSFAGE